MDAPRPAHSCRNLIFYNALRLLRSEPCSHRDHRFSVLRARRTAFCSKVSHAIADNFSRDAAKLHLLAARRCVEDPSEVSSAMAGCKDSSRRSKTASNVRYLQSSFAEVLRQLLEQKRPRSSRRPGRDRPEPVDSGIRIPAA